MGHIQEILVERAVHSWLLMKGCWRTVTVLGMQLPMDYFGVLGFCCVISARLDILDTSRTDLQGIVLTTDSLFCGLYTHNVRDTHGPISALPFHLETSFPFFLPSNSLPTFIFSLLKFCMQEVILFTKWQFSSFKVVDWCLEDLESSVRCVWCLWGRWICSFNKHLTAHSLTGAVLGAARSVMSKTRCVPTLTVCREVLASALEA